MSTVVIGGMVLLILLIVGVIATMLLPLTIIGVIIIILLYKILEAVSPAAPEIAEKTAEIANTISQFLC